MDGLAPNRKGDESAEGLFLTPIEVLEDKRSFMDLQPRTLVYLQEIFLHYPISNKDSKNINCEDNQDVLKFWTSERSSSRPQRT